MGIAPERFETPDAIPEAFHCGICLEVLCDPWAVCVEAEHVFCKECCESHFAEQQRQANAEMNAGREPKSFDCAICKNSGAGHYSRRHYRAAKFAGRLVGQLRVLCPNQKLGCTWIGELSNENGHLIGCDYRVVSCPNQCGEDVRYHLLREHRFHDCEEQKMSCPRGKKDCTYRRYERYDHFRDCQFWKCRVNKDCPTVGSYAMITLHEPYCLKIHESLVRAQSNTGLVDLEAEVIELRKELEEVDHDFGSYYKKMEGEVWKLRDDLKDREQELEEIKDESGWEYDNEMVDLIHLPSDIYDALSAEASRTGEIGRLNVRIAELESQVELLRDIKGLKEEEESALDEVELRKSVHPAYGVGVEKRDVVVVEKRKSDEMERELEEEEGPEYKARIVKWFP